MIIYISTLVISMLLGYRMQKHVIASVNPQYGKASYQFYFLLLVLLMGGVVGWRNGVGTDYGNYIDIYNLSQHLTFSEALENREALFGLLNVLCHKWFGNYVAVFVICGMVSCTLTLYGIKTSSSNYCLSIFLFITGMYYFDLFNGMRQMIATLIMFASYPLLEKKKWMPLCVLTVIATGFHTSALIILLAFVFATYVRPGTVGMWILIAVFAVIYASYNVFAEYLVDFLKNRESVYSNYEEYLAMYDQGANTLRFFLASVPPVFYTFTHKIMRVQRRDADVLFSLSLINALFMLIATKHWIFARFCMFFGIYNILLWPEILDCFNLRSKRFMTIGVIGVYFVYFWSIVHTDSNLLPYRSWLFGGIYG